MNEPSKTIAQKNPGISKNSKLRFIAVIIEISFVIVLLILWLSSEAIQQSKNLWVLFFYSFPSQFLIAVVPHEPVYFYFSKFYPPLNITLVAIAGTLLSEYLNYSVFGFFAESKQVKKVNEKKIVARIIELFNKAPFLAICIAGFTPIPFYPFRFIVVLSQYPLVKYLLAVFLSRSLRFYLFAYIGHAIQFPDFLLIAIFALITILIYLPLLKDIISKSKSKSPLKSEKIFRNVSEE